MQQREQRTEIRRTFIEGQGHLVEEVPLGTPTKQGQVAVQVAKEPPKALTVSDVSLELARQVCELAGLVVVPRNFLNPDQLQELGLIALDDGAASVSGTQTGADKNEAGAGNVKVGKMPAEQLIALVKQAESFDKLNALMADESRKTVIAAAEARAEELKAQGAQ